MTATLLTALLSFIATHASGILTGVVGTKISAWIAARLNTKTERAVYTDLILPLVQSVAALLQNVNMDAKPETNGIATASMSAAGNKPAVSAALIPATAHYND